MFHKVEQRHLMQKEFLVLARIGSSIYHQLMKTLASGICDLVAALLPLTSRRLLRTGAAHNQPLLLQLCQQRIEPPIAQPRIRTYHIIDDIGDEIAMRGEAHQQAQNNQFVHATSSLFAQLRLCDNLSDNQYYIIMTCHYDIV